MITAFLNFAFQNVFMVSIVSGGNSFPSPLTQAEEEEYLKKYKNGDMDAKNVLIERNLRLVAHITKKYQNSGIDADDLISIGTIGLIKAVSTYDTDKKIRIATYAARCIENEVLMVLRARKKSQGDVSLNEPIGFDKEGNEINLLEVIKAEDEDITEKLHLNQQIKRLYDGMKKVLQSREKIILEERYGLCGKKAKTQREVAKSLGISRSYVSRIEKKAVKKLCRVFDL